MTAADLRSEYLRNVVTAQPAELPPVQAVHDIPVIIGSRGSIGDYVWLDSNENGIQDSGEQGINGILIQLFNEADGSVLASQKTRSHNGKDGYYSFIGLPRGKYGVKFELPDGYVLTKPEAGSPDVDSNRTDEHGYAGGIEIGPDKWDDPTIDLGLIPRGKIGNYVWLDKNHDGIQNEPSSRGINGIEVRLYKGTGSVNPVEITRTADDENGHPGYYQFDHLLAGDYNVQFIVSADYVPTLAGASTNLEIISVPINAQGEQLSFQSEMDLGQSEYRSRIGWERIHRQLRMDR